MSSIHNYGDIKQFIKEYERIKNTETNKPPLRTSNITSQDLTELHKATTLFLNNLKPKQQPSTKNIKRLINAIPPPKTKKPSSEKKLNLPAGAQQIYPDLKEIQRQRLFFNLTKLQTKLREILEQKKVSKNLKKLRQQHKEDGKELKESLKQKSENEQYTQLRKLLKKQHKALKTSVKLPANAQFDTILQCKTKEQYLNIEKLKSKLKEIKERLKSSSEINTLTSKQLKNLKKARKLLSERLKNRKQIILDLAKAVEQAKENIAHPKSA